MDVILFLRETLFIERYGSGLCWCLVGLVSGEISRNCQSGDLPQAQIQMFPPLIFIFDLCLAEKFTFKY